MTLGRPGIVPASRSSTEGAVAPVTAIEQPSQLIPASQKTCTSVSGPSSLPPNPPMPRCACSPKTAPACGTFSSLRAPFSCVVASVSPRRVGPVCVSYI